jgi:hypothetical protein
VDTLLYAGRKRPALQERREFRALSGKSIGRRIDLARCRVRARNCRLVQRLDAEDAGAGERAEMIASKIGSFTERVGEKLVKSR